MKSTIMMDGQKQCSILFNLTINKSVPGDRHSVPTNTKMKFSFNLTKTVDRKRVAQNYINCITTARLNRI